MRIPFVLLLVAVLSACAPSAPSQSPFQGTDISGVDWGKDFNLVDHHGQRRTLADFHGKVVALFFGYTHCPDVCPTTLGELALTLKKLGKDAEKVQVLFVTLDPARDTPAVLAQYVPSFNPAFIGLTGSEAEVGQTAKTFKVFYQRQESSSKAGYFLDHSANTFVFDPQGRLRLMYGFGVGVEPILHDFKQLLAGK
jgi:protein SCO1/2